MMLGINSCPNVFENSYFHTLVSVMRHANDQYRAVQTWRMKSTNLLKSLKVEIIDV